MFNTANAYTVNELDYTIQGWTYLVLPALPDIPKGLSLVL